jgi:hypothetical protein
MYQHEGDALSTTMLTQRQTTLTAPEEGSALVTGNRVLAGALLGSQIVWLASVMPTYQHLTPSEYVKMHSLLTWYGDGLMPAVGFSATVTGYLRYRKTGSVKALVGSAALTAAGIGTLPNHRINIRTRDLEPNADAPLDEAQVLRDRHRWAVTHAARTAGGALASLALLSNPTHKISMGRPRKGARFGWMDGVAAVVVATVARELAPHVAMMARRTLTQGGHAQQ